jgi:invasion protein IalB
MKNPTLRAGAGAVALLLAGPALAQAPAAPPAASPAGPTQTTATYGDWTLRCVTPPTPAGATRTCEVVQTLSIRAPNQQAAQPIAQVALGSVAKGSPLQLTVAVPAAISFARQPQIKAGDTVLLNLAWRRCLPSGCFADVVLTAEQIRTLRARTANMQLAFQDAANQDQSLNVSPKGLAQSLDALGKEDAGR